MPNVRPLNKKYGLTKHEFQMVRSFCFQYYDWKEELKDDKSTVKSPRLSGTPSGNGTSNATENLAIRRTALESKISLVEDTVKCVTRKYPTAAPYLLDYVTDEYSTYYMMEQKGIPIGRTIFYELRRQFYYELNKVFKRLNF